MHCTLLAWGSGRVLDWLELVDRSTLAEDWRREEVLPMENVDLKLELTQHLLCIAFLSPTKSIWVIGMPNWTFNGSIRETALCRAREEHRVACNQITCQFRLNYVDKHGAEPTLLGLFVL